MKDNVFFLTRSSGTQQTGDRQEHSEQESVTQGLRQVILSESAGEESVVRSAVNNLVQYSAGKTRGNRQEQARRRGFINNDLTNMRRKTGH